MHAKSVWMPSSLEISSLLKVRPGIRPRFFNQKIAQNDPEKKMPSIAANATSRSANELFEVVHFRAHAAFLETHGIVWIALNKNCLSSLSEINVSINML